MECGWNEPNRHADDEFDECPKCGTRFNNYYIQKVFATGSDETDATFEDIENAESVSPSEIQQQESNSN